MSRDQLVKRLAVQVHEPRQGGGPMITSASGVAGQGRSTAGSISLLELGHIDLIGKGINVVMLAGAFHRPDTERKPRCARRSDDTEKRKATVRCFGRSHRSGQACGPC
jgi:hypothetical protein